MTTTDKKLDGRYVIAYHGGFVSSYNKLEGGCEWVGSFTSATTFPSARAARIAANKLDLDNAQVLVIASTVSGGFALIDARHETPADFDL